MLLGACNALQSDFEIGTDLERTFDNCAATTKIYSSKKLSADKREILLSLEGLIEYVYF